MCTHHALALVDADRPAESKGELVSRSHNLTRLRQLMSLRADEALHAVVETHERVACGEDLDDHAARAVDKARGRIQRLDEDDLRSCMRTYMLPCYHVHVYMYMCDGHALTMRLI